MTPVSQETRLLGTRVLGGLFGIVSLLYLRFIIMRHEPFTMIQMVILLCAAAFLFLLEPPHHVANPWFRGWRPIVWQGWIALAVGATAAVGIFVVMDTDSHSVSDTLNRIVPTHSLLIALIVRLWLGRGVSAAKKLEGE